MYRSERIERIALLSESDALQTALFQQAAAATFGLGITEMRALSTMLRQGPQTAGALARTLNVTSGAVTGVVDRLVRRGLARRGANPTDRRKVVVSVDLEGLAAGENVYLGIGEAFQELYANYTDTELEFLERHLAASIEITARETARLHQQD